MSQTTAYPVAVWGRLPLLVRSVVEGFMVFLVLQSGWTTLMVANWTLSPAIPWSVPLGLLYLWAAFRFFNGNWGPGSKAGRSLRMGARRLSREQWRTAIPACLFVLVFFVAATVLSYRVIEVPAEETGLPEMPWWSLYATLLMVSIVAGVSEEAGFRGYMQGSLERRYGVVVAIGVGAVAFWLAHLNHASGMARGPALVMMGASLGALTHAARSVLPAMVTHATADAIIFVAAAANLPPHYLWHPVPLKESGLDAFFWVIVGVVVLSGLATAFWLSRLQRVAATAG